MVVLSNRAAVRRLLDRFGFGPGPGDVDAGVTRGFAATAAALLNPSPDTTPEPNLGAEPARAAKGDTAAKKALAQQVRQHEVTLTSWWLDRMVATNAPLTERMTWFWHGHFATSEQKVRSPRLMQRQNDTLRSLGTGQFTALAKAMMVDPAMLIWLDAQLNKTGAANENLARESMELFMLGVDHYTETDVREAARALTGWVVNRDTITAQVLPRRHDNGTKTVLGTTGNLDADSFADVVLGQPNSPKYIVGRIWSRLVCGVTPPAPDVLARLVAAYGPNRDVHATLQAITQEAAFTDSAQALVKQPVEWVVGLMRALRVRPSQLPAKVSAALLVGLRDMGQVPFLPPNVGGWPADTAWLTTSAGLARLRVAQLIAAHADLSTVSGTSTANRLAATQTLLSVDQWSGRTTAALNPVADTVPQLVALAACAPEYVVSL